MLCGSCAGFIKNIQTIVFPVSWLSMRNTWVSPFPTDVSCSLPHLQKGSLVAALWVSAGVTWCGWLCFLPTRVSWGSYDQSGMQADMRGRGSRRIGCWDGSSKTQLWTPLIVRGEKSIYPELDSSCPCACAKRRPGKKRPKTLFWVPVSLLITKGAQLPERRDLKNPEIRWYQTHHSFRNQGNFRQGLDIWHFYVDTIMCGDACMCNIIPGCRRNCYLQDDVNIPLIALPSYGHLVLKTV